MSQLLIHGVYICSLQKRNKCMYTSIITYTLQDVKKHRNFFSDLGQNDQIHVSKNDKICVYIIKFISLKATYCCRAVSFNLVTLGLSPNVMSNRRNQITTIHVCMKLTLTDVLSIFVPLMFYLTVDILKVSITYPSS